MSFSLAFIHGPWFVFPMFFWFVLLAVALSFFLRRRLHSRRMGFGPYPFQQERPQQLNAMEILGQRYARGEIDGDTFEHMRERLQSIRPEPPRFD